MTHLPSYLHVRFFSMQMRHFQSFPHVYSSVFKFLRHTCKEQIRANPFFSSTVTDVPQEILYNAFVTFREENKVCWQAMQK